MKVVICSKSPSKLKAVQAAFEFIYPDTKIEYIQVSSDSSIHIQPIGVEMTMAGAMNRISSAMDNHKESADFYVSIESGVNLLFGDTILCFSGVVVYHVESGYQSKTLSAAYPLPYNIYHEGIFKDLHDVGEITDAYFETQGSKSATGCFGLISNGLFTRDEVDAEAIKGALLPFISEHFGIKKE